ncbi:hypothetical protein AB0K16_48685 [Nonomuraea jabiensis]
MVYAYELDPATSSYALPASTASASRQPSPSTWLAIDLTEIDRL